jgi:hypothetical protein
MEAVLIYFDALSWNGPGNIGKPVVDARQNSVPIRFE